MIRILIVEDELPISSLLEMKLTRQGYHCEVAHDGKTAADMIEDTLYDLILLDVMIPVFSGFDLMEYIRPMGIPVIFLTAKGDVQDRVAGLKKGAEDYIVKPFEMVELVARIEVVLRRFHKGRDCIHVGSVVINVEAREVTREGHRVELTVKEFDLLVLLAQNPNIALFRETLFERVWGSDFFGETRTLDSHIQRLRKKLGWEERIKTVYKVGYRLDMPS
jgi:two-component system alkaline phosphatase synthesis response regulator PhoP